MVTEKEIDVKLDPTAGLESKIEQEVYNAAQRIERLEEDIVNERYAQARLISAWEALTEQKWPEKR